jgi:rubredoxin
MDTAISDTPRPMPQFHCSACGFGASSRIAPERCPNCSGTVWELVETHSVRDLDTPMWRDRAFTDLWRL